MWICGRLAPCAPGENEKKGLIRKHVVWQSPSSSDKKSWTFQKISFLIFLHSTGPKSVSWVRKRCFRDFWTECEGADLKQRKGITKMDHRNKIQSLVLPADDARDASDCITECGSLPGNMAIYAINQPISQTWVFPGTQAAFSLPGAAETAK